MEQQKSSFSRICWYILTASILVGSYGKTTVHFSNWNQPVLATELQHVCRVVDCLALTGQWPKLAEQHFQIGPRMGMREWNIFYVPFWHIPRNWRKSYDKITSCGDTEIEACGSPISHQNVPRKHLISCVAAALCHSLTLVQKKKLSSWNKTRALTGHFISCKSCMTWCICSFNKCSRRFLREGPNNTWSTLIQSPWQGQRVRRRAEGKPWTNR